MGLVGRWRRQMGSTENDVAYIFEDGYSKKHRAYQFLEKVKRSRDYESLKGAYAMASHTFADRRKFLPLQAADYLAWETVKQMRTSRRTARKSMEALFPLRHVFMELNEISLNDLSALLRAASQLEDAWGSGG